MVRRSLGVFTTVALSFLALSNSSTARTTNNSKTQKYSTAARSQPPSSAERLSRKSTSCAPCAKNTGTAKAQRNKKAKPLACHPKNYVDPKIATNYRTAMRDMKRAGIKPQVTSTWRSSEFQAQLHKCSQSARCRRANPGLYYALPPGESLHEAAFAVDISGVAAGPRGKKHLTQQGHRIVSIMRKNGFDWRYRLKDPAHFEADPRKHGYRNTKQAIARTQSTCQIKLAKNQAHKKTPGKVSVNRGQTSGKTQLSADRTATKAHRRNAKAGA